MRKIAAILIALATMAIATPAASAAEEITKPYTGSSGYFAGPMPTHPLAGQCIEDVRCIPSGRGYAIVFCPRECDFNGLAGTDPGTIPVINPVGGRGFITEGFYSNAIFRPNDEVYGTGAAISACIFDPDGDNTCDGNDGDGDTDYGSDWTCGTVSILGAGVASDRATTWILTLFVSEDASSICGGSTGTITGNFF